MKNWVKTFASFIRHNYAWLLVTSKKASSDFDDSPTFAKVSNELVDPTSNKDLKSLCIRNLNKIVVSHLNFNSIRNKFDFLAHQVQGHTDILIISETKLYESFPLGQFSLDGCSVPFRFERDWNGGVILLLIRGEIPLKLLRINNNIEGFFFVLNLRNKKKWLLSCSTILKKHLYQIILQHWSISN